MSNCSVACDLHDFIEIACMYHYQVKLTLKDQTSIEGKAIDTLIGCDKREYLVIDTGQKQQIELNQLRKLQVLTPKAQFTEVSF
ncbi:Rho-binding antiterminator [Methylomonas rapida]|uniref:Rho-binding antiterminator n=1 Tax=Methylomonas rapida TaxID=2963939 RepID=A0ABY7GF93_9GAMM|nr:Rho-binding antiterminator [Methylomonas rapida]WAR43940.1 Rho-binding antiterminator [Methylomonas rapida]